MLVGPVNDRTVGGRRFKRASVLPNELQPLQVGGCKKAGDKARIGKPNLPAFLAGFYVRVQSAGMPAAIAEKVRSQITDAARPIADPERTERFLNEASVEELFSYTSQLRGSPA